jgi:hypothetical protein
MSKLQWTPMEKVQFATLLKLKLQEMVEEFALSEMLRAMDAAGISLHANDALSWEEASTLSGRSPMTMRRWARLFPQLTVEAAGRRWLSRSKLKNHLRERGIGPAK